MDRVSCSGSTPAPSMLIGSFGSAPSLINIAVAFRRMTGASIVHHPDKVPNRLSTHFRIVDRALHMRRGLSGFMKSATSILPLTRSKGLSSDTSTVRCGRGGGGGISDSVPPRLARCTDPGNPILILINRKHRNSDIDLQRFH